MTVLFYYSVSHLKVLNSVDLNKSTLLSVDRIFLPNANKNICHDFTKYRCLCSLLPQFDHGDVHTLDDLFAQVCASPPQAQTRHEKEKEKERHDSECPGPAAEL